MATPRLIIGLGHRKRVGKDTFAAFLDESLASLGWWVVKQPIALAMKESANELFRWGGLRGMAYYECFPDEKETVLPRLGKSPRDIWIAFGNAMRAIHPDVWVETFKRELDWYCGQYADGRKIAVIVPDVRFPNEAKAIKSWGGVLMEIRRSSAARACDPAETALDDYRGWSWSIANEGSLEDLRATAREIAGHLTSDKQKGINGINL